MTVLLADPPCTRRQPRPVNRRDGRYRAHPLGPISSGWEVPYVLRDTSDIECPRLAPRPREGCCASRVLEAFSGTPASASSAPCTVVLSRMECRARRAVIRRDE